MSTEIQQHKKYDVKLLVIGTKSWLEKLCAITDKLSLIYHIQFISDINQARERLWHNSYDILIIEQQFTKIHTINLSKMAYAMFRPSIVICDNIFKVLKYKFWQLISKFSRKYKTFKTINSYTKLSENNIIMLIEYYHKNKCDINIITKQISGQFLYEYQQV